jgi:hypothetical protein
VGIAFSNQPIIPAAIVPDDDEDVFKAAFHDAATAAGWTAEVVTGGYLYTLESPQEDLVNPLDCKVRVINGENFGGTIIGMVVRFESSDGLRLGRSHALRIRLGRTYEVWAGASQLFISCVGYSSDSPEGTSTMQHACAGGVPYVPIVTGDCAAERVHETTEAWWSAGTSFRYGWAPEWTDCGGCYNGVLNLSDYTGQLILGAQASPEYDFGSQPGQQVQWHDGTALYLDPMLIWERRMRAQIWDAIRGSKHAALDHEITTEEAGAPFTWRNWMSHKDIDPPTTANSGGTYHSALYLLQTSGGQAVNVAY